MLPDASISLIFHFSKQVLLLGCTFTKKNNKYLLTPDNVFSLARAIFLFNLTTTNYSAFLQGEINNEKYFCCGGSIGS